MMEYATLDDVLELSGKAYTGGEQDRIEVLLPLIADALRLEAEKAGKNLDSMAEESEAFKSVVKLVMVDVVCRVLRQSQDGDPLSQESQSALGYSWSGTYAVPGGGIANAILRNDLKRLGLHRQRYGSINLWEKSQAKE